jgi:hypothetical protein
MAYRTLIHGRVIGLPTTGTQIPIGIHPVTLSKLKFSTTLF